MTPLHLQLNPAGRLPRRLASLRARGRHDLAASIQRRRRSA
jgi:hypothetical protein